MPRKSPAAMIGGALIAMLAVLADCWHNTRWVARNATPEQLASIALTLLLTVGAWVRVWQFFRYGAPFSYVVPSALFELGLWALVMPVWARMVWRSTVRELHARRDFAHVGEEFEALEAEHAALITAHAKCSSESTGRHHLAQLKT